MIHLHVQYCPSVFQICLPSGLHTVVLVACTDRGPYVAEHDVSVGAAARAQFLSVVCVVSSLLVADFTPSGAVPDHLVSEVI